MGIPSYYKRLCQSVKGLVVPHRDQDTQSFRVGTLVFDFNCMIYQVVRHPEFPPFPGSADEFQKQKWELHLCEKVVDYTLNVWRVLGKPANVFLGLDGVVPMAKIRQQRLRRFKSIWTASQESQPGAERWDTNALTPGTNFMKLLGARLRELCTTRKWTLSDTSQPGEGEHKCMIYLNQLPLQAQTDATVIYGLDADLILLSLLHAPKNSWLLREVTEWEGGKDGKKAVSEFMRLSIDKLLETYLVKDPIPEDEWKLDYIAAMSLLGNDFVPHSLTFKIRDGGHDKLLTLLQKLHSSNERLVIKENVFFVYNLPVLKKILAELKATEENRLLEIIKKKSQFINHEDSNLAPCEWAVEKQILCEGPGKLYADWNGRMLNAWFGLGTNGSLIAREYFKGLQWVLDYYTHQCDVDMFWMFAYSLPPSWTVLFEEAASLPSWQHLEFARDSKKQPIQDYEQLAVVLPLESWNLIQHDSYKDLPSRIPQFWPQQFGFFSAGRTFLWECEPRIPILTIDRVRTLVRS